MERTSIVITGAYAMFRTLYYDPLGRPTNDCVATVNGGIDTGVLQIGATYEVRGMLQTVSSYDNAVQGSGTVVNQGRKRGRS